MSGDDDLDGGNDGDFVFGGADNDDFATTDNHPLDVLDLGAEDLGDNLNVGTIGA